MIETLREVKEVDINWAREKGELTHSTDTLAWKAYVGEHAIFIPNA